MTGIATAYSMWKKGTQRGAARIARQDRRRHEQVASRGPAHEALAAAHPEPAGDPLGGTGAVQPARAAAAGDEELAPRCVVAAFGIEPVEDAARRAAHAARAIQAALGRARAEAGAPWSARIGLHVEEFLVGQVSGAVQVLDLDGKRKAWSVLDALVNAAEPDTTLLSAQAAPFLDRRFELLPTGPLPDGGPAYRLAEAERAGFSPRGLLTPFVGRGEEIERLRERLRAVLGGHGQPVGVGGDAGIGKSRLLFEFRQQAEQAGVRYLEGRCVAHGRPVPSVPFADVIRGLCEAAGARALPACRARQG